MISLQKYKNTISLGAYKYYKRILNGVLYFTMNIINARPGS